MIKVMRSIKRGKLISRTCFLDEVLNEIGMPFSIKSEASDYMLVLREDSEKVLTVRDISEGEKNLLALMYFFFEMYDDSKQKHLKDEIKLVIVDDPTSSMDNPNRFYVMSLIRALLAEKGNVQVFVFTHVWDDFCEYSYKKESQSDCAVLEVCKQDGASTIRSCDNSIFPYKQMFRKVNQFACLKKGSPEVEKTALLMPNTMRRVLEEYLRYHTECSGVSSGNVQQIGSALYNSREKWDKNASTSDHTKVSLLINITNVFSHRIDTIVSNEEIYRSARFMMQRIFDNNKTHYEAMVPENERMKWT
jgi:wobble nucleotide-excising tRNase